MAYQPYLRISGIDGPVLTPSAYAKWIKILSYSFGVDSSGWGGIGRGSGKVRFDEFSITKAFDNTSAELYSKCVKGEHIAKIQMDLTKLEGKVVTKFMELILKDILITHIHNGRDATEDVTFNFAEMSYKYENATGTF